MDKTGGLSPSSSPLIAPMRRRDRQLHCAGRRARVQSIERQVAAGKYVRNGFFFRNTVLGLTESPSGRSVNTYATKQLLCNIIVFFFVPTRIKTMP